MCKLNCDIVKDLMPSYLDGICSESSKKAVEEHAEGCTACRAFLQTLKKTEIVTGEPDVGELDYMKKVKKHYTRKNAVIAAICFILLILIIIGLFCFVSARTCLILFPVTVLAACFLLSDYKEKPRMGEWRILAGIVGAAGIFYCIGLKWALWCWIEGGVRIPFGMALSETGPFIDAQLAAIIVAELLLFAGNMAYAVKEEHAPGILPVISLAGVFLSVAFREGMRHMETALTILQIRETAAVILEGIGLAVLILLVQKAYSSRK